MRQSSPWRQVAFVTCAASNWLDLSSGQLVKVVYWTCFDTFISGAIEASLEQVRKFRTTIRNQQAYLGEC